MIRLPPRVPRTDPLFPYTAFFRPAGGGGLLQPRPEIAVRGDAAGHHQGADRAGTLRWRWRCRSEEHTSELQSLMRNSYAVFCLKKKKKNVSRNREISKVYYPEEERRRLT